MSQITLKLIARQHQEENELRCATADVVLLALQSSKVESCNSRELYTIRVRMKNYLKMEPTVQFSSTSIFYEGMYL